LFGEVDAVKVHLKEPRRMSGFLALQRADVEWFLSVDGRDLPAPREGTLRRSTHRSIEIDGSEVDFTDGFQELHTKVYEKILKGSGFGIEDARPSIALVHRIKETL
jgi:UDP-N-acetyl-2-amino-2-deoxyglucuronate dehydrogenase